MDTIRVNLDVWSNTDQLIEQIASFQGRAPWLVVRDAYLSYLKDELPANEEAIKAIDPSQFLELRTGSLDLPSRGVGTSYGSSGIPASISITIELYHYRQFQLLSMVYRSQRSPEKMLFEAINRHIEELRPVMVEHLRAATV